MDINENDLDWKLTKKLRREDPDQFQTLVRMHLSFVLDLNTDEYVIEFVVLNEESFVLCIRCMCIFTEVNKTTMIIV